MLRADAVAPYHDRGKMDLPNRLDLTGSLVESAKLGIEITALLHGGWRRSVDFVQGKLREGIPVWRSAEQSQEARASECLKSTSESD
jgi:hypothetical protein